MPAITIETGKLNKDQKRELVTEFTKKLSEVMNVPQEAIMIFIKENESDNVGFGGKLLSESN